MKWKDSESANGADPDTSDPYYENDGYASFKEKGGSKAAILSGNPVRYLYWGLGIAVVAGVVLLVALLFSNINESADLARIKEMEQTIEKLEQRLSKYEGIDEKVTRIWEQAKAFEKFKTRFDRSEASMSLRMDHLAMSLDALQKKTDEALVKIEALEKQPAEKVVAAKPAPVKAKPVSDEKQEAKIHTVVAGDTLFNISQRYNLTVDKLKALNNLSEGAVIHVGQKLTVSAPAE
ncbi:LysM peptidoglycan-binding domain-containing protein [uncultured Desulfosarcina sp.]|uniref:LysM peptidoglycan-binding domain-containing protein n=1 Tax=uncultured Desulfosarcina sp. TaxID=218289 RepID=UPI0029C714AB|nr:LysM peptidoglycan-binding domain-containing protein [uncultured Desulfosarcina sp.]